MVDVSRVNGNLSNSLSESSDNTTSDRSGIDITNEIEVDNGEVELYTINELAPSSTPITIPYLEVYRTNELEYVPYMSPFNVGCSASSDDSGSSSSSTASSSDASSVVDTVVGEISKFSYSNSCSDGNCIKSSKKGDCWALSDYIVSRLKELGVTAKIYQYATSGSSRHRQVKYQNGSSWEMFPYSKSGIDHNFYTNDIPSDAKEL